MKIYAIELESYPANHRNDVGTIIETLDVDIDNTNKPEEELLEEAAQILEEKGYWVYRENSGGRCVLAWEIDGTPVAIISVAPEAIPVWEEERFVGWKAQCPYCGRTLEIDSKDAAKYSKLGPLDWAPWQTAAHCQDCRTQKVSVV